jgi:hypothetical protein
VRLHWIKSSGMVQIGMQHPVGTQRQNQKDESADQAPASNHGRHKSERSGMEFPAEQRGKKMHGWLRKGAKLAAYCGRSRGGPCACPCSAENCSMLITWLQISCCGARSWGDPSAVRNAVRTVFSVFNVSRSVLCFLKGKY